MLLFVKQNYPFNIFCINIDKDKLNVSKRKCCKFVTKSILKTISSLHLKSAIGSASVVVFGVGAYICGLVSDSFGRKVIIMASLLLGATFNILASFSTSYAMYFALYQIGGTV